MVFLDGLLVCEDHYFNEARDEIVFLVSTGGKSMGGGGGGEGVGEGGERGFGIEREREVWGRERGF